MVTKIIFKFSDRKDAFSHWLAIQSKLVEITYSITIHNVTLGFHGSVDALIYQPLKIQSDIYLKNVTNRWGSYVVLIMKESSPG